jgi:hypothetical protein
VLVPILSCLADLKCLISLGFHFLVYEGEGIGLCFRLLLLNFCRYSVALLPPWAPPPETSRRNSDCPDAAVPTPVPEPRGPGGQCTAGRRWVWHGLVRSKVPGWRAGTRKCWLERNLQQIVKGLREDLRSLERASEAQFLSCLSMLTCFSPSRTSPNTLLCWRNPQDSYEDT